MTTLITGGTGKTGSRVAHRLNALHHSVRAVTRHSEPRFDWYDDSTWDGALTGCTSAYLTFQPDIGLPGADAVLGAFARRAVALGCTRLVLLSAAARTPHERLSPRSSRPAPSGRSCGRRSSSRTSPSRSGPRRSPPAR